MLRIWSQCMRLSRRSRCVWLGERKGMGSMPEGSKMWKGRSRRIGGRWWCWHWGLIGVGKKIVSTWRRYVDVSISMVESMCESSVGKGRDGRCNGSEDEGAWRVRRRMHGRSWERGGEYGWGAFLIQVVSCSHHWSPTPFRVPVPCPR